jgi:hypothetical protein
VNTDIISIRHRYDIDIAKPLTTYQQKVVVLSVKTPQNCCGRRSVASLYTVHTGGVANCIVVRSTELSASAGVGWEKLGPVGDEMLMKVSAGSVASDADSICGVHFLLASHRCHIPCKVHSASNTTDLYNHTQFQEYPIFEVLTVVNVKVKVKVKVKDPRTGYEGSERE